MPPGGAPIRVQAPDRIFVNHLRRSSSYGAACNYHLVYGFMQIVADAVGSEAMGTATTSLALAIELG